MACTRWSPGSSARIRQVARSTSSPTGGVRASRFCAGTAPDCGSAPTDTLYTARIGRSGKVLYLYHPLFGKELEVFGAAGGKRDLVYVKLPNNTTRGIPAWMFDEVICAGIRSAERPIVDCRALLKLAVLLDSVRAGLPGAVDEITNSPGQEHITQSRHPISPAVRRSRTGQATTRSTSGKVRATTARAARSRRAPRKFQPRRKR